MDNHLRYTRKNLMLGLGVFFLALGLIFVLYWVFSGQFYESTDDAYIGGNLVQVMPQTSGQVTAILVDETSQVKKGDPVVLLDKADADIALKNAESQLALTVRQVNQLYQKIGELSANVKLQQDNLEKAQEDYRRRQGLVVDKTISREELRHAKIAVDSASDALSLSKSQLASAVELVGNTTLYHHPQVEQAIAALRNAYLAWERTTIFAPESGYVAKRTVEVGQQVTPNSTLMVIVPLDQVWVNANFKESQLKDFRIGQPVKLISDTYGSSVKFKGSIVGLNPGAGNTFDLLPPQNATGNWIKIVQRLSVRIAIDPNQLKAHPLQLGLSMTAIVDTHHRSGKSLPMLQTQQHTIYQTKDYNDQSAKAEELVMKILQANAQDIPASSYAAH